MASASSSSGLVPVDRSDLLVMMSIDDFDKEYPREAVPFAGGSYGQVFGTTANKNVVVKVTSITGGVTDLGVLSCIRHPNITRILAYAIDAVNDKLYLAFPKGVDLIQYVKHNPSRIPQIFAELLCAVGFLQSEWIAHCDIKPDNIIIVDHHPVLIDFGLAHFGFPHTSSEALTSILYNGPSGSFSFDSPYAPSDFKNIKTDLFALGKTLESIFIKYAYYYSSLPMQTGDKRLDQVFKSLLSDDPPNPSAILEFDYFKENGVVCTRGQRITEQLHAPNQPTSGDVTSTMYYILIGWLCEIFTARGSEYSDIRTLFLVIHNIHRTWNLFGSTAMTRSDIQAFGVAHMIIAGTLFETYEISLQYLIDLSAKSFTKKQLLAMLKMIIDEMKGIIYSKTQWDLTSDPDDLIMAFKTAVKFDYVFKLPSAGATSMIKKHITARGFVQEIFKLCTQNNWTGGRKLLPFAESSETFKVDMSSAVKLLDDEPTPIGNISPFKSGSLAMIYRERKTLLNDPKPSSYPDKGTLDIFDELCSEFEVTNSIRTYPGRVYDIIFGEKIQQIQSLGLQRYVGGLAINPYTTPADKLLSKLIQIRDSDSQATEDEEPTAEDEEAK